MCGIHITLSISLMPLRCLLSCSVKQSTWHLGQPKHSPITVSFLLFSKFSFSRFVSIPPSTFPLLCEGFQNVQTVYLIRRSLAMLFFVSTSLAVFPSPSSLSVWSLSCYAYTVSLPLLSVHTTLVSVPYFS
ncbi:hypothetical protein D915_007441 [Fasciola hepatica]|uniref:Uncharacterized protein n=1 Tax=Fasciola hepatica TaxID=6192 RepID=A0A2H1BZ45_FASHE|nr:hypothetical protein D915_007441 [Fasciola hepatica]